MNWNTTSLEDVFHLALPMGTELVTPHANLQVSVSWACCSRPSPPAFPSLEGGELALVNMNELRVLDTQGKLAHVIHRLKEAQIAGIAVQGDFDDDARATAVADQIPLFAIPERAHLPQVERDTIRLIVDRSAYILQRATHLQREMNQITLDGGGLEAIANHIHHVTNQPFVMLNAGGHVVTTSGLASGPAGLPHLQASLPNIMQLRSWAVSKSPDILANSVDLLPLSLGSRPQRKEYNQCAVSAVVVSEEIQGYCLLLRKASDQAALSPIEEMAVSQGAAAAAIDWVTRNAVGAAEERMRASFLDELLASRIADEQAWIRRGRSLGYDLERPHSAWMLEAIRVPDWPASCLDVLRERQREALFSQREEGLLLYCPLLQEPENQGREAKQLALDLVEQLTASQAQARLHVGIGRAVTSPAAWLQSQQQAWESLRVNKKWGTTPVTLFEDLGLYQFLIALRSFPETEHFYQTTLADLLEYDAARNAELLDTLNAYFICHGNISQTAVLMRIHRNTLTYRLNRITDITRLDLDDPDVRFGLQLALKLHRLYK